MVQQISLVSSILENQFRITELSLTSLTGMLPQELSTHTVILKPKFPFTPDARVGKPTQIEQYRMRMTRIWEKPLNWTPSEENKEVCCGDAIDNPNSNINESIWTMQISDIPAGGKRKVLIQNMYETTILSTDDILGYVDELGYMVDTEYWSKGVRFYHNDVIVELYRLYVKSGKYGKDIVQEEITNEVKTENGKKTSQEIDGSSSNTEIKEEPKKEPASDTVIVDDDVKMEDVEKVLIEDSSLKSSPNVLKLLDKQGKYFVKAYVNVEKLNDLDNTARATKQLESFKNEVLGLIDLEMPDRVSMDSRLNSRLVANAANKPN